MSDSRLFRSLHDVPFASVRFCSFASLCFASHFARILFCDNRDFDLSHYACSNNITECRHARTASFVGRQIQFGMRSIKCFISAIAVLCFICVVLLLLDVKNSTELLTQRFSLYDTRMNLAHRGDEDLPCCKWDENLLGMQVYLLL